MTPTRDQTIDMSIASGLNDRLRLDSEAGRILSVQCLERFAVLAYSAGRAQGLREAREVCEAEQVADTGTEGDVAYNMAIGHCATAIKQLEGK